MDFKRLNMYKHLFWDFLVSSEIEELQEYIQNFERWFENESIRLKRMYKEKIKKYSKLDPFEEDFFAEEYEKIKRFWRYFRYSVIVLIFSILEHLLEKICNIVKHFKGLSLNPNDLKGQGIERAKNFIRKACKIPFPSDSSEWKFIQDLLKVRNCIVHTNGKVDEYKNPEKLKDVINHINELDSDEHGYVIIKKELLPKLLNNIKKLLGKVCESCFCDKYYTHS